MIKIMHPYVPFRVIPNPWGPSTFDLYPTRLEVGLQHSLAAVTRRNACAIQSLPPDERERVIARLSKPLPR